MYLKAVRFLLQTSHGLEVGSRSSSSNIPPLPSQALLLYSPAHRHGLHVIIDAVQAPSSCSPRLTDSMASLQDLVYGCRPHPGPVHPSKDDPHVKRANGQAPWEKAL